LLRSLEIRKPYCDNAKQRNKINSLDGIENLQKLEEIVFESVELQSTNAFSGAIGIYGHSYGCVISNNTITASGQIGITVDGSSVTDCANTLIIGNTVSYSATRGINLTSAVRTSVIGNIVYESSTASAGTSANIMITQDGTTACVDTLIEGNMSAGGTYARSAITVDNGPPAPSLLKLQFNDFQPCVSYTMELNGVGGIEIDGRIQFRFDGVGYGPISNGASFSGPLTLTGAAQGDVCTVSHTSNTDGCVMMVQASATNTGVIVIANLSGGSKTIASGTLRVDVWKRNAPN
jgi:parallel beta-helix repeat protein